jgi:hypothetical protein
MLLNNKMLKNKRYILFLSFKSICLNNKYILLFNYDINLYNLNNVLINSKIGLKKIIGKHLSFVYYDYKRIKFLKDYYILIYFNDFTIFKNYLNNFNKYIWLVISFSGSIINYKYIKSLYDYYKFYCNNLKIFISFIFFFIKVYLYCIFLYFFKLCKLIVNLKKIYN